MKSQHLYWLLSLFATAFGAGVLYVPVDATGGTPLLIIAVALLAACIIAVGHIFFASMSLSQSQPRRIGDIVEQQMGTTWRVIFAWVFFLATFTILLVYSIGIHSEYANSLYQLFGWSRRPGGLAYWISIFAPLVFIGLSLLDTDKTIRVISSFIFILLVAIVFVTFYLWFFIEPITPTGPISQPVDISALTFASGFLPLMIFGMNFSPIIPRFGQKYQNHTKPAVIIIIATCLLLVTVICAFILACHYALPDSVLHYLKTQPGLSNASILTLLETAYQNDLILHFLTPFISMLVLTGAFIGTFIGAQEATENVCHTFMPNKAKSTIQRIALYSMIIIIYGVIFSPFQIKSIISDITSPAILTLIFIIPAVYWFKIKQRQRLKTE